MKSILIVNNKKGRCKCCPLLEVLDYNEEECKCYMNGQDVTDVVAEDKYAYTCPLKPMPIKEKGFVSYQTRDGVWHSPDEVGYAGGWNACIDEILGEKE